MNKTWLIVGTTGAFLLATAAMVMLLLPAIKEAQRPETCDECEGKATKTPPVGAKLIEKVKQMSNETGKPIFHMFESLNETAKEMLKNKTKFEEEEETMAHQEKNETSSTTTHRTTRLDESLKYQIGGSSLLLPTLVTIGKVPLIPVTIAHFNVTTIAPLPEIDVGFLTATTTTSPTTHKEITGEKGGKISSTIEGGEIKPLTSKTTVRPLIILHPKTSGGAINELPSDTGLNRPFKRSSGKEKRRDLFKLKNVRSRVVASSA